MTINPDGRRYSEGVTPSGSGYSAEPEPCSTVSAVPVSIPNASRDYAQLISLALRKSGVSSGAYVPTFSRASKNEFEGRRAEFKGILWDAQQGVCARCDKPMRSCAEATFDHVTPTCLRGNNWIGNLLLMHPRCNHHKASALPGRSLLRRLEQINARIETAFGSGIFERQSERTGA